jgi:hypothetical protein
MQKASKIKMKLSEIHQLMPIIQILEQDISNIHKVRFKLKVISLIMYNPNELVINFRA